MTLKEAEIDYRDKRIEALQKELQLCQQKNKELEHKIKALFGV
tara:strand:+ start:664 stop:792 length:129 start_codon:yes stop_codon:yes gene_type:complete